MLLLLLITNLQGGDRALSVAAQKPDASGDSSTSTNAGETTSKEEECLANEKSDNGSTTCQASAENESPRNLRDFMKVFKTLGTSWKHVFGSYMDVVKTAHGKEMTGDVFVDDFDQGIVMLKGMVDDAVKSAGGIDTEEGRKWKFDAVPLSEFDFSVDKIFLAFLRWSGVDSSDEDEHEECDLRGGVNKKKILPVNVTKAFRRLSAYAKWMDEQRDILLDPPLTLESIKKAKDLIYSRVAHDDCDRVVWWLDLGQTNFKEIKHLKHDDILRFFVWLSHLVVTDEKAQTNGIIFLDSMDQVSFYQYMTMLPYQLGITIDKFMIGVTPLKTKLVVFLKRPFWFDVGFGLLSVFLPQRMKKRVEQPANDQASIEGIVGIRNIPVGFDDFNGTLAVDMIAEHERREK